MTKVIETLQYLTHKKCVKIHFGLALCNPKNPTQQKTFFNNLPWFIELIFVKYTFYPISSEI